MYASSKVMLASLSVSSGFDTTATPSDCHTPLLDSRLNSVDHAVQSGLPGSARGSWHSSLRGHANSPACTSLIATTNANAGTILSNAFHNTYSRMKLT